jgi:hypothetical protein
MTLAAATWRAAIVGRWTARIVGTLMALFFLAFVVGEGPPPLFKLSWQQNLQFLGMAGLFLGLLLAWKWEGWGGLAALVSFALLLAIDRRFNTTWFFLLPAGAAVVHVLCWWRIASGPPAAGTAWEVPRTALWLTGAAVGVFILLCANEIFGQPPLMTPALRPSAELVGRWHGQADTGLRQTASPRYIEVDFSIAADGTVSGHVGDRAFTGGRIANNRSWFGALMHWRDPYEIRGGGFDAGTILRGQEMDGGLVLAGESYRLTLRKQ